MKNEELMRLLARRQKRNRKLLTAGRFLIGILFFAIWELCARFGIINDFIFSSPSRVIRTIQSFAANNTLWLHVSVTLKETALSFFMTMVISLFTALLFCALAGSLPKNLHCQSSPFCSSLQYTGFFRPCNRKSKNIC